MVLEGQGVIRFDITQLELQKWWLIRLSMGLLKREGGVKEMV